MDRSLKRRIAELAAGSVLAAAVLWPVNASAHPERIGGLVLTVLAAQREAVIRHDGGKGKSGTTTLLRLSPRVDVTALHDGDRIVGLVDDDSAPPTLDEVKVIPAAPAPSAIRVVHPLNIGDHMPATRFVDQRGRAFSFADFRGKSVVLAFIYTRCRDPKECPAISSSFHVLQTRLGNGPYHLVEMTLDPSFDRPDVLAKYGQSFRADAGRWTFGTGDAQTVLDFDARFGIDPFADPKLGVIHTERTVIVDPDGKIVDFIDQAGWDPADVVARLQSVESRPSNPLARLDFELSKAATAVCGNRVAGFSGLEDLAIVLVIIGAGGWILQRLARKIFAEHV
ncbi:MAG: SCO family protein [Candidatus Eremiobacteraeota bacterium]|nr:SCO family protein [Candidatus Eremiobacteraeota bacterium]